MGIKLSFKCWHNSLLRSKSISTPSCVISKSRFKMSQFFGHTFQLYHTTNKHIYAVLTRFAPSIFDKNQKLSQNRIFTNKNIRHNPIFYHFYPIFAQFLPIFGRFWQIWAKRVVLFTITMVYTIRCHTFLIALENTTNLFFRTRAKKWDNSLTYKL